MKIKSLVAFLLQIIFFSAIALASDEYTVSVPLREPVLLYRISSPESGRYTPEQIKDAFEGKKYRNRQIRLLGTEGGKEWSENQGSVFPLHPQPEVAGLDRFLQLMSSCGLPFSGVFVNKDCSVPLMVRLQASQDGVELFVKDLLTSDWWDQSNNVSRVIVGDELKIISTNDLDRLSKELKEFSKQPDFPKIFKELRESRIVKSSEILSEWFQRFQSEARSLDQCSVTNGLCSECTVKFEYWKNGKWMNSKLEKDSVICPGKELRFSLQEVFPDGEKFRCRVSLSRYFTECEHCWSYEFSRDSMAKSASPIPIKIHEPEVSVKRPRIVDGNTEKEVKDRGLWYSIEKGKRKQWKNTTKNIPLHKDVYFFVGRDAEKACFSTNFVCGSDTVRTIPDIQIPSSSKSIDDLKPVVQGNSRKPPKEDTSEKVDLRHENELDPCARECQERRDRLAKIMKSLLRSQVDKYWIPFVLLRKDNIQMGEHATDLEWLCKNDGQPGAPCQHIYFELQTIFGKEDADQIVDEVLGYEFNRKDNDFSNILKAGAEKEDPLAALLWDRWKGNLEKLGSVFEELKADKVWNEWQKGIFKRVFTKVLSKDNQYDWVELVKCMNNVQSSSDETKINYPGFPRKALGLWYLYCDKNPRVMFNAKMQDLGLTSEQRETINTCLY